MPLKRQVAPCMDLSPFWRFVHRQDRCFRDALDHVLAFWCLTSEFPAHPGSRERCELHPQSHAMGAGAEQCTQSAHVAKTSLERSDFHSNPSSGRQRSSGLAAVQEMAKLYAASRVFVNVFQPSRKLTGQLIGQLIGETREGAGVRKRYSAPKSPCDRLIAREDFPEAWKTQFRRWANSADPIAALAAVRHAQERLARIADKGEDMKLVVPPQDLTRFIVDDTGYVRFL